MGKGRSFDTVQDLLTGGFSRLGHLFNVVGDKLFYSFGVLGNDRSAVWDRSLTQPARFLQLERSDSIRLGLGDKLSDLVTLVTQKQYHQSVVYYQNFDPCITGFDFVEPCDDGVVEPPLGLIVEVGLGFEILVSDKLVPRHFGRVTFVYRFVVFLKVERVTGSGGIAVDAFDACHGDYHSFGTTAT